VAVVAACAAQASCSFCECGEPVTRDAAGDHRQAPGGWRRREWPVPCCVGELAAAAFYRPLAPYRRPWPMAPWIRPRRCKRCLGGRRV
jgi:hypothetical protein